MGGAVFSWLESLSSLVGLSGCGKYSSWIQTKCISAICTSTGPVVTSEAALHGGMGSGVVFSSTVVTGSVMLEASDIGSEWSVGVREERDGEWKGVREPVLCVS